MQPATAAKAITDVRRGGDVLMNERPGRRAYLDKVVACFTTRRGYGEAYQHGAQQPDQEGCPGCAMRGHSQRVNEMQRRRRSEATQTDGHNR